MSSEIDINNLRQLHAATSQGKWGTRSIWLMCGESELGYFVSEDAILAEDKSLVEFVASAHNNMPALLDELERLRAENAALKGKLNE